jgi:hypothetical protein
MLKADGYPNQLFPIGPLARLKLSRTTVIGNPLEVVGDGVKVKVGVTLTSVVVGDNVGLGVIVQVGVRVGVLVDEVI